MEPNGSVLTTNVFLDRFGEVVLRLDPDGLSWEPIESKRKESDSVSHAPQLQSCLEFMSKPMMGTKVKFSDIYAAEDTKFGLIHKAIPNTKGLFCEGYSEMHRFVVHGSQRSKSQHSLWVLAVYTFGHIDLGTCQMWVDLINVYLSKEVGRPKNLLVFVHPFSGRKTGRKIWENVKPIFSHAKVKTEVVVTERAGHARDYMKSLTNTDLNSFDGILAVGGDGFFNEILNGLLSNRYQSPYPPAPQEFMDSAKNKSHSQFATNKFSSVREYANEIKTEFTESLEKSENEPFFTDSESILPDFINCTDAGNDSTFLFPNNWFRLGIIPAGSTDSIVLSSTGVRDPVTSSLHVVLGKRACLDIAQVVSWKENTSNADSVYYAASFAGYGFYGDVITESEKFRWMGPKRYDYAGTKVFMRHRSYEADVVFLENTTPDTITGRESKDTRIQTKEIVQNLQENICRVNCLTCNQSTNPSTTLVDIPETSSGTHSKKSKWVRSKGRFQSIGAAIISCRNEKAPDGLVADAHLADGFMHLILIKECPRPLYLCEHIRFYYIISNNDCLEQSLSHLHETTDCLEKKKIAIISRREKVDRQRKVGGKDYTEYSVRHLIQLTKKGSDPLHFEFVEHHKTQAFTFVTYTDESVWNLDGEILRARQLSAKVCRGLVSLFASGPEV